MREIGKICNFRRILTALAVILLLSLGAPRARAQDEIYEKSGAEELYQVLDEDAKDLLSRAGVEGGMVEQGVSGKGLLEGAGELLRDKLGAPFKALAALIGILVLCRLGSCFEDGALGENVQLLGAAACGAVMAGPVLGMLNACRTAADSASAFMEAAVPREPVRYWPREFYCPPCGFIWAWPRPRLCPARRWKKPPERCIPLGNGCW